MLKKIFCLALVLTLLVTVCAPASFADDSGLTFTAINDRVLDISMMPVSIGGVRYVQCAFFNSYFGIGYTYSATDNTATLSQGESWITFNITDGTCTSSTGNFTYKASTANGVVYVPVFIGSYFGLRHTSITGKGYGDILRIVDGTQYLSDSQFNDAAQSTIQARYLQYYGGKEPEIGSPATPSPSPDINGAQVFLSFTGLPTPKMLDTFASYSIKASFFVTAEEAEENPEILRRIICEGHILGALSPDAPGDDIPLALDAIFNAAFCLPTIIRSAERNSDEHRKYAAENGLLYYTPEIIINSEVSDSYSVTSLLPQTGRDCNINIASGTNCENYLSQFLYYLAKNGYNALPLLEIHI